MQLARQLYHKVFVGSRVRGVYPNFAAAQAAIPPSTKAGYDHQESANLYPYLLDYTKVSDFAALFYLSQLLGPHGRLFDFGGNTGVLYYAYQRRWTLPPNASWTVCDVPAVAEAGRALAQTRPSQGLHFTSRFEDAAGADVLLTSGTLQYVPDSLPTLLGRLGGKKPKHILANRTPLWDKPAIATLQNLGPVTCPYQIFNRGEFLAGMAALGYEAADTWLCPESGISIRFRPNARLRGYTGLYLRLKDK